MTVRANPVAFSATNTIFNTAAVAANETDLFTGNNFVTGKAIVLPVPRVSMTRKDTQLILSWSAVGGGLYAVEATDKLVPANWVPVATSPNLSGGMMNVTITPSPTNQSRFYRIRPQ